MTTNKVKTSIRKQLQYIYYDTDILYKIVNPLLIEFT